jgi:uncharacterized protein
MMNLFVDECIEVYVENDSVLVKIKQKHKNLSAIKEQLKIHPRVILTDWKKVEIALMKQSGAAHSPIVIGEWKPVVQCSFTNDKMQVYVYINLLESEFESERDHVKTQIYQWLASNKVTHGVLTEAIENGLRVQNGLLIAEGTEAVNGNDAKVTYFQLSERKPRLREDGSVDHFEISFIDEVKKGDWLGEKTFLTNGADGMNVLGQVIRAKKGNDVKLLYDPKSVYSSTEDSIEVLRASIDGAVSFDHKGLISVVNVLTIDGDVGIRTGNIQYDGSVVITGTVTGGFSVTASNDISILSEHGVTSARVESLSGDILIKGGIFGKAVVKAKNHVFAKHANEALIDAGGNVTIGKYIFNSYIKAANIFTTDQRQGKIIGGKINTQGKVASAIIGNQMGLKTEIHIDGFDRDLIEKEKETLLKQKEDFTKRKVLVSEKVNQLQSLKSQSREYLLEYMKYKTLLETLLAESCQMEHRLQTIESLLLVKGMGEVASSEVYPGTFITIKNIPKRVETLSKGSFYLVDGEITLG